MLMVLMVLMVLIGLVVPGVALVGRRSRSGPPLPAPPPGRGGGGDRPQTFLRRPLAKRTTRMLVLVLWLLVLVLWLLVLVLWLLLLLLLLLVVVVVVVVLAVLVVLRFPGTTGAAFAPSSSWSPGSARRRPLSRHPTPPRASSGLPGSPAASLRSKRRMRRNEEHPWSPRQRRHQRRHNIRQWWRQLVPAWAARPP